MSLPTPSAIPGLARALQQSLLLTTEQAVSVHRCAQADKQPFIEALIRSGILTDKALAKFCSRAFGYPLLDLRAVHPSSVQLPGLGNDRQAQVRHAIPLAKSPGKISVAMADPTESSTIDQFKFRTGLSVDLIIVAYTPLMEFLARQSQSAEKALSELIGDELDSAVMIDEPSSFTATDTKVGESIDDAPVVRFLQKILIDAINLGASDLHFEPFEKFCRIRFRIDGELRDIAQPPLAIKDKLASRIKVISRLDIAEKRVPQDGRMKMTISSSRSIDFRVSTLPTLFGEKIVMRILDGSQAQLGIDALGYEPEQKAALLEAIHRPHGMVLVTGPTGSGKTVSLYTCLNLLNQPGTNISTAEDPAEINLPGVNQVNINERSGLTFPIVLRAFLRQDPDVLMVGEIRDLETADIAIKAAQTGHRVFSTLHTNDAPSTLTRLLNMGVAPFNIASAVRLISAQRLARRLCSCRQPEDLSVDALLAAGFAESDLQGWIPYRAVGCERCGQTGYKGRVGIYQVMPVSEAIESIILSHGSVLDIAAQAKREGVKTMRESGLLKVRQGLTTLGEVLACTYG
jgi:type IV pilus assembly protein PilB